MFPIIEVIIEKVKYLLTHQKAYLSFLTIIIVFCFAYGIVCYYDMIYWKAYVYFGMAISECILCILIISVHKNK